MTTRTFVESRIELGGVHSRALTSTPKGVSRAILVCLHGWSDSADTYKPLLEALGDIDAAAEATVIALDFPGFGEADALKPGAMLPQFVAFANAAFDHYATAESHPGTPLIAVGQSLGGRAVLMGIAAEFAAGRHSPVAAAVIIGPAPLKLPPWKQMLVRNLSLSQGFSNSHNVETFEEQLDLLIAMQKRTCFAHPERVPDYVFADYARHVTPEYAKHHVERLRQFGAEAQAPLDLRGVDCPVELLWGDKDRIAPLSGAQAYLDALPHARLKVLEDCGHHAHLEQPEIIAVAIRQRLGDLLLA